MTDYELTRRDALAALATTGAVVGGAALTWDALDGDDGDATDGTDSGDGNDGAGETSDEPTFTAHERETLLAVARTVYPSDVSGIDSFVESYVVGRVTDRPERAAGMRESLAYLDEYARRWFDATFVEMSPAERDETLNAMGADVVEPEPTGIDPARLRFYLINELLYALYASPTGGTLLGLENPQGYPGGTESYQRGPE